MTNNLPILTIRDKNISCSVFKFNSVDGKENYSICIQRSYKKKDSSDYTREEIRCYPEDLLKISNICSSSYNKIIELQKNKKTPEKTTSEPIKDDCPF